MRGLRWLRDVRWWRVIAGALLLMVAAPVAWAILVAPQAIFLSDRERTGEVHLVNTGSKPEDVQIDLEYGYPATDSAGQIGIKLIEDPDSGAPSAASWVRAFPHRVVVQPGQRQVVRLLATPPAGLKDGEYWSRILVTSRGAQVAVATPDSNIHAGLNLVLRTIISLTYRKGAVHTGVTVDDFRVTEEHDSLVTWLGLTRTGNAAYLGNVHLVVQDSLDHARATWDTPIAVYFQQHRRLAFPADSFPPGRYTVHLTLDTKRSDLPQDDVLPVPAIERSAGVVLH
ncbi:MAG TPA: hypothetical protein VJ992_06585 [Gemmatimonadales bacterium]|nr:hypothetical protein [Gemmatimonadales bacterium]